MEADHFTQDEEIKIPGTAIFLVGASILLFEILLTRIFSVTMWYHFAFVAISLALFGIAASGVAVAVAPQFFTRRHVIYHMGISSFLLGLSIMYSFLLDLKIPIVPFDLPGGNPLTPLFFFALKFILLSLPFFFGGLIIALAFTHCAKCVHKIYFYDLAGGGVGCMLAVPILLVNSGPSAIILISALAFLASWRFFYISNRKYYALMMLIMACAVMIFVPLNNHYGFVKIINVKAYDYNNTQVAEKKKIYERWHPTSRVAVHPLAVSGNNFGWFYARSDDLFFPALMEVTNDAGARTYLYPELNRDQRLALFKRDVSDVVFQLTDKPDVLVIGVGGGKDIISALAFDANKVVGVEINPVMIDIVQNKFAHFTGAPFSDNRVTIAIDEGRNYIASRKEKYDVIKVSVTDTWAASAAGAYTLTENYLYTVEAIQEFMNHLKPNGYLTIIRWYPVESIRLTAMVAEALRKQGYDDPQNRVLFSSNRQTVNMIIKNGRFTRDEIENVTNFTQKEKLIAFPGNQEIAFKNLHINNTLTAKMIDNIHLMVLQAPDITKLSLRLPFSIKPTVDNKPFFFNSIDFKDAESKSYFNFTSFTFQHGRALNLLMGLFKVSLAVTFLFLLLPMVLKFRHHLRPISIKRKFIIITYFLCLGLGYLLIEIPLLQLFILFLGHPVYTLVVVLFSLLLFSGIGSLLAGSNAINRKNGILFIFSTLVIILAAYIILLPDILRGAIGLHISHRILLTVLFIFPVGLLMGMPFPIGINRLHEEDAALLVPWAWAVNGAASVTAPILSILLAILAGFSAVLFLGVACYVTAGLLMLNFNRN